MHLLCFWSAVADFFACIDDDEELISGQGSVSQATTTVHVDAVVL